MVLAGLVLAVPRLRDLGAAAPPQASAEADPMNTETDPPGPVAARAATAAEQPPGKPTPSPSPSASASAAAPTRRSGTLAAPPAEVVRAAIQFTPLTRFHRDLPGGAYINTGNTGGHIYVLALAARAGDTAAEARLLEQIRLVLTGGNDIAANGGYPAQHELQITGVLAIVRHTPHLWQRLTEAERHRADLSMTAALVSGAFTTSDRNPYLLSGSKQYTLDGDGNVDRGYNPNFREGMVGSVLVAVAYFGPERAAELLANYRHAEFVAQLAAAGLDNAYRTFTWKQAHPGSAAPTGAQIEQAVRDWSVWGIGLDDPMQIYADVTAHTYGLTAGTRIECGHDGGQGVRASGAPGGVSAVIDSGCAGLPNAGRPGMLLEFDSVDGGGVRSSAEYAYGGFKANLFTRIALIAGGLWEPDRLAVPHAVDGWAWPGGTNLRQVFDLVRVGGEDLWYKLDHGYREYASGRHHGVLTYDSPEFGFLFLRSLWRDVILPHHGA